MMREAYLITALQGSVSPFSSLPHAEQVRPMLQTLFEKSGVPARRVRQLHWHGGDQEFWLSSLIQTLGFAPDLARFQWPTVPLLAHLNLQAAARAIEAGDTDLVLLAQETGDQAVALLLASPAAVGIYNLSPRACLRQKLAVSSAPNGLLQSANEALQKAQQKSAEQDQADQHPADQNPANREPGKQRGTGIQWMDIQWLASTRRLETPVPEKGFSGARWITPDKDVPPGDLFLLCSLAKHLEEEKAQGGLLLSEGPQKSGLVTLLERI